MKKPSLTTNLCKSTSCNDSDIKGKSTFDTEPQSMSKNDTFIVVCSGACSLCAHCHCQQGVGNFKGSLDGSVGED